MARITNQVLARMLLAQLRAALCISRVVGAVDHRESREGHQTLSAGSFVPGVDGALREALETRRRPSPANGAADPRGEIGSAAASAGQEESADADMLERPGGE